MLESETAVATGNIRILKDTSKEMISVVPFTYDVPRSNTSRLNANDFYKELRLRGYHYKDKFKNVVHVDPEGSLW